MQLFQPHLFLFSFYRVGILLVALQNVLPFIKNYPLRFANLKWLCKCVILFRRTKAKKCPEKNFFWALATTGVAPTNQLDISLKNSITTYTFHILVTSMVGGAPPLLVCFLQSGRKCGVGSQRICSHFFQLLARILTIFDKIYRILMCRDKRECYLIVLQQNNV